MKVNELFVNKENGELFQIHAIREDSVAGFFVKSLNVGVLSFEDLKTKYREAEHSEYEKALDLV